MLPVTIIDTQRAGAPGSESVAAYCQAHYFQLARIPDDDRNDGSEIWQAFYAGSDGQTATPPVALYYSDDSGVTYVGGETLPQALAELARWCETYLESDGNQRTYPASV